MALSITDKVSSGSALFTPRAPNTTRPLSAELQPKQIAPSDAEKRNEPSVLRAGESPQKRTEVTGSGEYALEFYNADGDSVQISKRAYELWLERRNTSRFPVIRHTDYVSRDNKTESAENEEVEATSGKENCESCSNRKYVDGSDDSSVSFQAPTHVGRNRAAFAVAAHEHEHVSHSRSEAQRKGRVIISQSVSISYAICPECGRSYVSGGVTHTRTAKKPEPPEQEQPEPREQQLNVLT